MHPVLDVGRRGGVLGTRIKSRLSYANVMSSIAVFVVLGGGAYATIDRKIGSADIQKGAVTTPKIKKQAVKTGKIRDQTIRNADVRPDHLPMGGIRGDRIVESSLSQVPSAATAADADLLDGLDSTAFQRARTRVFQASRAEALDFATGSTLAELTLAQGTYLVLAKLSIIHPGAGNDATTTCDLSVPGPNDDSQKSRMGGGGTAADQLGFPLATTFTGSGDVSLSCTNFSGNNDAFNIKLIALRVD
jgi:hypothetical protein